MQHLWLLHNNTLSTLINEQEISPTFHRCGSNLEVSIIDSLPKLYVFQFFGISTSVNLHETYIESFVFLHYRFCSDYFILIISTAVIDISRCYYHLAEKGGTNPVREDVRNEIRLLDSN